MAGYARAGGRSCTTRTPSRGASVIARNWTLAGSGSAARSAARSSTRASTIRISSQREAGAQAAAGAAAERDPACRCRAGRRPRKRSGAERAGVGVEVLAAVDQADRRVDLDPGRDLVAAEAERLAAHDAADAGDHRPDPQRLLDDRVEVRARRRCSARSSTARRRAARRSKHQARPVAVVSCPASSRVISSSRTSRSDSRSPSSSRPAAARRTRRRCSARARRERRAGGRSRRRGSRRRPAARGREAVVQRGLRSARPSMGSAASSEQRRAAAASGSTIARSRRAEPPPRRARARSRTPPAGSPAASATACSAAARTARRPARRRSRGRRSARIASAKACIRRPWNGRQHQPAVAQVLGAVEQQHRALADDRAEHRVGLAGAQLLARALEQLLDQRRVEHHHEPLVEQRPERDHVAVAPAAGVDEPRRRRA